MGVVISILLALGLLLGQHELHKGSQQQQSPPNCTGSGCGLGGGGGGGF